MQLNRRVAESLPQRDAKYTADVHQSEARVLAGRHALKLIKTRLMGCVVSLMLNVLGEMQCRKMWMLCRRPQLSRQHEHAHELKADPAAQEHGVQVPCPCSAVTATARQLCRAAGEAALTASRPGAEANQGQPAEGLE